MNHNIIKLFLMQNYSYVHINITLLAKLLSVNREVKATLHILTMMV